MKGKSNIVILLSKSWYLLGFGFMMGYFLGSAFQKSYEVEMYGFELVLALFSVGLIWAGLNVGFNIGRITK